MAYLEPRIVKLLALLFFLLCLPRPIVILLPSSPSPSPSQLQRHSATRGFTLFFPHTFLLADFQVYLFGVDQSSRP
ncbi:hypothetical protein FN846DRAFT_528839 [Sphaerosporella brunnea]|uniref:Uncharacterized protein n=1 Tax=Sphaerosporella brunnea TaxID=1250544 RepID=A0A5J5EEP4_9PEZI|nr:hypothetical protein FN846DRAFT_528839 [Sphaerosporella brunnea]